jgi:hypothetical protein
LLIADSQQIVHTGAMFKFEKLDVWQKAIDFADLVYSRTTTVAKRQGFLNDEDFVVIYKAGEEQGRMLSGLRHTLVGV